jgi:hypothetical protein
VLDLGSPREVLTKLIDGDPLELGRRCQERTTSQALLLDARRLYLRTCAHVARHAGKYAGTPSLDVWLAEHVRRALKELVAEDAELLRARDLAEIPEDPWVLGIANLLGIEPALASRGCAAFNQAAHGVRSAFFGIVIGGQPIADWASENGTTPERARADLKRALWLLGARDELDLNDLLEGLSDEP